MKACILHTDLIDLMKLGFEKRVFSGAALLVGSCRENLHATAHGTLSRLPAAEPVTLSTCFDLASLTKILCTTSLVIEFVQSGLIGLEDKMSKFLPGYHGRCKEEISILHLLEHSSGLAAWRPYYHEVSAAGGGSMLATHAGLEAVRSMVLAEIPRNHPGTSILYSDIGFMLLGWILELIGGKPIDDLFTKRLASGLKHRNIFFIDLKRPAQAMQVRAGRTFAATENCSWRGRTLIGEVHDDNAYAMGGVCGHAGLFADIYAVADLARIWMDSYQSSKGRWDRNLVRHFWTPSKVPDSNRALGFDMRSSLNPSSGRFFGAKTVGHTGFTGTSLWIDPEKDLMVVLLTNRVHPRRENDAMTWFRPHLHDAVMQVWEKKA